MKYRFLILSFCLTASLAACTPSGSSSTDQTQKSDSQTTATQEPVPAPAQQSEEPILAEVPDAPTPEPMGWSQFDAYFKQLQVVYDYVLTDSVPMAESKALLARAEDLAKDKTKEHEHSAPQRKMLADQVRMFMERSGDVANREHWMEVFPMVLMSTKDFIQTKPVEQIQGYPEKLENMRVTVDNELLKIRFKRQ
jgi:hypothetical protein